MLKKFLIGTFAVLALMVASTAFASYDFGPTTLKVGSTGEYVKTLQTLVGATPVDGKFGPITKAKVMAWQTNNGLVADGLFGNLSKAAANGTTGGTTVTLCPNGMTLASNCTTSPTTTTTTTTGLTGEGSVNTWSEGSAEYSSVREGENNKEVYQITADLSSDGDLLLDRVDVYFGMDHTVTANTKPWTYFKDVSLTVDGVVVATNDAGSSSNWTENDTSTLTTTNQEYRMRFSGFSAVLKSGTTAEIGVRVSIQNTIDTTDQDAEWQIGVTTSSFKITDGKGFATTEGVDAEEEITFGATKAAVITLRDASTNPDASVIKIDATEDTNDVTIYAFEIEETNNVKIDKISEITATFTTGATAGQSDESEVIRRAYLYDGSTLLGSETVAAGGAVTFDNLNFSVDAKGKKVITVKVDLDDVAAGLTNATDIKVGSVDLSKFIDANGNDEGDIAVTATGDSNTFELRTSGIQVTLVGDKTEATKTFIADAAGEDDQGTYKVVFDVKAFGADMYIDKSSEVGGANAAGQGVEFMVRSTAGTPVLGSDLLEAAGTVTGDNTNVFKVLKDTTRRFTLTVIYSADSTPTDGSHEVYLESINWGTANDDTNTGYYTFDLDDYKTGYLFLNGM